MRTLCHNDLKRLAGSDNISAKHIKLRGVKYDKPKTKQQFQEKKNQ